MSKHLSLLLAVHRNKLDYSQEKPSGSPNLRSSLNVFTKKFSIFLCDTPPKEQIPSQFYACPRGQSLTVLRDVVPSFTYP